MKHVSILAFAVVDDVLVKWLFEQRITAGSTCACALIADNILYIVYCEVAVVYMFVIHLFVLS